MQYLLFEIQLRPNRRFVMRKLIIVTLAFVFAGAGISACGGSNEATRTKAKGQAPIVQPPADLAQKASVTSVTPTPAVVTPPEMSDTTSPPVRFELVLDGKSGFAFNAKMLSDETKARIDEMFTSGKVDLKDAHFQIEGHTDNAGSKALNERIGLERAEAVRQYICQKYEVPMESISVVSYGLEKPVADNATEEGRAQNRRVVIKVLD
jgi:outer membrane protein OmpA-like peptidoglycan-associated protein